MKSDKLRNYEEGTSQYFLYKEMHENQTIELVKEKKRKYGQC